MAVKMQLRIDFQHGLKQEVTYGEILVGLQNGKLIVLAVRELQEGVHPLPDCVGWSMHRLTSWAELYRNDEGLLVYRELLTEKDRGWYS